MINVHCEQDNGDVMDSFRARRGHPMEESLLGTCDCTSYCYFALAVVLFTVGTIITVLALDEGSDNMFSSLGHMWLVGPIFISSGLMVAVKTVLYLRKKNLMALIIRQRALLRELQGLQVHHMVRTPSILTLPPAYEIAVSQPESCRQTHDSFDETVRSVLLPSTNTEGSQEEPPPPTYEEAMLLGLQSVNQSLIVSHNVIESTRNGKDLEG